MAKRILFLIAEDDFSYSIAILLDDLLRELDGSVKVSSKRYLGAIVTEMKIKLRSLITKDEKLHIVVYAISEEYREEYKARFNVKDFPVVNIGGREYFGEDAVSITSDICSLLTSKDYLLAEQIFYYLSSSAQRASDASSKAVDNPSSSREAPNKLILEVYRSAFEELISRLERLRKSGVISEERYNKIRRIYAELLEAA